MKYVCAGSNHQILDLHQKHKLVQPCNLIIRHNNEQSCLMYFQQGLMWARGSFISVSLMFWAFFLYSLHFLTIYLYSLYSNTSFFSLFWSIFLCSLYFLHSHSHILYSVNPYPHPLVRRPLDVLWLIMLLSCCFNDEYPSSHPQPRWVEILLS